MRRVMSGSMARDRGAMTVLVAILTVGILLGLGALVINTGSWYSERAQLQNGADSSVLAVAQSCATSGGCNTALATGSGSNLGEANNNANDDVTAVDVVCGDAGAGALVPLPACSAYQQNGTYCPAAPASGHWVNVHTSTLTSADTKLPVLGNLSLSGTGEQVKACAQATWGAPTTCGNCAPISMSLCEWYKDTNNGSAFASPPTTGTYHTSTPVFVSPPSYLDTLSARKADPAYGGAFATINDPHSPPNTSTVAASESVLLAHSTGTSGFGAGCNTGSDGSNQSSPGQFSWIPGTGCTSNINGSTFLGQTGSNGQDCTTAFTASRNNMTPIFLPVYSSVTGTGANSTYTLAGFAAFIVTGWAVHGWSTSNCDSIITANDSSLAAASAPTYTSTSCSASFSGRGNIPDYADYCGNYLGVNNCNGNANQAIYGYFTQALIPASDLPGGSGGGTPLGATSVSLTG